MWFSLLRRSRNVRLSAGFIAVSIICGMGGAAAFPVGGGDAPAVPVVRVQSPPALSPACQTRQSALKARQGEIDRLANAPLSCRSLKTLAAIQQDAGTFLRECVPNSGGTASAYLDAARKTRAQMNETYPGGC